MRDSRNLAARVTLLALSAFLAAGPAGAKKPDHPGKSGHEHGEPSQGGGPSSKGASPGSSIAVGAYFSDSQRASVRSYYGTPGRTGACPPGLAKKGTGCLPPGQAKKWRTGYPLPKDVVYYEVPRALVVQLGTPPAGYRYVRVAADILMIAAGTGLVVDAIEDLVR